jgi:hypothetical protein
MGVLCEVETEGGRLGEEKWGTGMKREEKSESFEKRKTKSGRES